MYTRKVAIYYVLCAVMAVGCKTTSSIATIDNDPLPEAFLGTWQGELKIYQNGVVANSIPMEMTIERIDSLTMLWKTTYTGEGTTTVKDYLLRTWDAQRGQYEIDEKNGINLQASVSGSTLSSIYAVMGRLITVSHSLRNGDLHFQIDVTMEKSSIMTGDTILGGDTIPPVTIYPVLTSQHAILKRVRT